MSDYLHEYRDAYDRPRPARVPRLGRREPGRAPGVTPEPERPAERRTAPPARSWTDGTAEGWGE